MKLGIVFERDENSLVADVIDRSTMDMSLQEVLFMINIIQVSSLLFYPTCE